MSINPCLVRQSVTSLPLVKVGKVCRYLYLSKLVHEIVNQGEVKGKHFVACWSFCFCCWTEVVEKPTLWGRFGNQFALMYGGGWWWWSIIHLSIKYIEGVTKAAEVAQGCKWDQARCSVGSRRVMSQLAAHSFARLAGARKSEEVSHFLPKTHVAGQIHLWHNFRLCKLCPSDFTSLHYLNHTCVVLKGFQGKFRLNDGLRFHVNRLRM